MQLAGGYDGLTPAGAHPPHPAQGPKLTSSHHKETLKIHTHYEACPVSSRPRSHGFHF